MKKYAIAYLLILGFTFFWWFNFVRPYENYDEHICRDYDLVTYTTKAFKSNPKELARFHFKRARDCQALLKKYGASRGMLDKWKKCGVMDAAFDSVIPLTKILVQVYDDNDTAHDEITATIQLIQPFSYCPQYAYVNKTLSDFKQKLGL